MDGVTYREDFKCWWPDYDHRPEKCFGFVQRGLHAAELASKWARGGRVAIQAGGHAGHWARVLDQYFDEVHAFEPDPALFECMSRNTLAWNCDRVTLYRAALGEHCGPARMMPHPSAGSWRVHKRGTVEVEQVTVDSLNIMERIDAIMLDVEGSELPVLRGARRAIHEWKPLVLVEYRSEDERKIAKELGPSYKRKKLIGRDAIWVHRERR